MRVFRLSIGVGAVLFFALACGGGDSAATPAPGGIACGAPATQANVNIADFSFLPASVQIAATQVVTWANQDGTAHTVTFDNGPDCGQVAAGSSVSASFGTSGSFAYHCTIHPTMKGTVVVQ